MDGIDVPKVTAWFEEHIDGAKGPLEFELIAGGRSNLTFKVTDANGVDYVLRRPPLGHVLATAHDMGREHRIISALAADPRSRRPRPRLLRRPRGQRRRFYVMGFVDGLIVRDPNSTKALEPDARPKAGENLVDVLAAIHDVDPDDVGLGDLGRKEGYIARQLKRWYSQFNQSKLREVPLVDEMHDFLSARIPEQQGAAIVHGDYRLDNCMLTPQGDVAAVLDWEICTLGDPLADVGLLMVYWNDPGRHRRHARRQRRHRAPGLPPTRRPPRARYAARSDPRPEQARLLHRPSGTGSSPASSTASTPATSRARWATTAPVGRRSASPSSASPRRPRPQPAA